MTKGRNKWHNSQQPARVPVPALPTVETIRARNRAMQEITARLGRPFVPLNKEGRPGRSW